MIWAGVVAGCRHLAIAGDGDGRHNAFLGGLAAEEIDHPAEHAGKGHLIALFLLHIGVRGCGGRARWSGQAQELSVERFINTDLLGNGRHYFRPGRWPAPRRYWSIGTKIPRSVARTGSARWPLSSSASAISPSAMRSANAGAGSKLGRFSARPSAFENSAFVTGDGLVAFTGPRAPSAVMLHDTSLTQSSLCIHGMYCVPEPSGPPTNIWNGGSIFGSAPPRRSSTMPVRTSATRVSCATSLAAASQSLREAGQKVGARRGRFGQRFIAAIAVVADSRSADECGRRACGLADGGGQASRGEQPAVAKLLFLRGRPPLGGDRLAGKVDDGGRRRRRRAPTRRRCRPASRARTTRAAAGMAAECLPREDGDVVPVGGERAGERRAEESGPAGDDDAHGSSIGLGATRRAKRGPA